MTQRAPPYSRLDLERGEQVVRELHGLQGFDAWAQHIAQVIATERERVTGSRADGESASAKED